MFNVKMILLLYKYLQRIKPFDLNNQQVYRNLNPNKFTVSYNTTEKQICRNIMKLKT